MTSFNDELEILLFICDTMNELIYICTLHTGYITSRMHHMGRIWNCRTRSNISLYSLIHSCTDILHKSISPHPSYKLNRNIAWTLFLNNPHSEKRITKRERSKNKTTSLFFLIIHCNFQIIKKTNRCSFLKEHDIKKMCSNSIHSLTSFSI